MGDIGTTAPKMAHRGTRFKQKTGIPVPDRLFQQDIGNLFQLGSRTQQVETLCGKVTWPELTIGRTIGDDPRLQGCSLLKAYHGLPPSVCETFFDDDIGKVFFKRPHHQIIGIETPFIGIEEIVGLGNPAMRSNFP